MIKTNDFFCVENLKTFHTVLGFEDIADDHEPGRTTSRKSFVKDDYLYHEQILSILNDKLYNFQCETNLSKELQESLTKYEKENLRDENYGKVLLLQNNRGKIYTWEEHVKEIMILGLVQFFYLFVFGSVQLLLQDN